MYMYHLPIHINIGEITKPNNWKVTNRGTIFNTNSNETIYTRIYI